jgi:hypothetical protein
MFICFIIDLSCSALHQELKKHPAFMTDYDETKPMSPALEGLQALKYQSDSNDGMMACTLLRV